MTARTRLKQMKRSVRGNLVAVPVAPPETVEAMKSEVDEVVCLSTPADFYAIGQFYVDFDQVEDDEVRELLEQASARAKPAAGAA